MIATAGSSDSFFQACFTSEATWRKSPAFIFIHLKAFFRCSRAWTLPESRKKLSLSGDCEEEPRHPVGRCL